MNLKICPLPEAKYGLVPITRYIRPLIAGSSNEVLNNQYCISDENGRCIIRFEEGFKSIIPNTYSTLLGHGM